jgi:predicted porin
MKNKLKLTTALVGSLVAISAGSALAQQATTYYDNGGKDGTTVSGNMNFSYREQRVGNVDATTNYSNLHGFGKEVQININNRGKLNNGWGYAAGFSIEADGTESGKGQYAGLTTNATAFLGTNTSQQTSAISGIYGENNFIDIIIGDTTLSVSADHIQNPDSNPTMMGAPSSYVKPYAMNAGTVNYSTTLTRASSGLYPSSLQSPYENAGVGIIQKTSIGSFSALYVPNRSSDGGSNNSFWGNDNGNTPTGQDYNGGKLGTAYELGFMGALGVPGLMTSAWYNHSDLNNTKDGTKGYFGKMDGYKANVSYVIGSTGLTAAAEYALSDIPSASASPTSAGRVKAQSVGLSYAITKDFTVAGTYAQSALSDGPNGGTAATTLGSSKSDEKIKVVSAGYSLGAVAIKGQYRESTNLGGTKNSPSEHDFLIWSGVNF